MIDIQIRLTPDDYVAFNHAHWKASFNSKARTDYYLKAFFTGFLSSMTMSGIISFLTKKPVPWYMLLSAVIIGGMVILYSHFNFRQAVKTGSGKLLQDIANRNMLMTNQLNIDNEFILSTNEISVTKMKWLSIARALTTKEYFFFYTDAQHALIIPKRDMNHDDQARLASLIRDNINHNYVFVNKD